MNLAIVVVVDGEGADVVAARGNRDRVAVLLTGGDGREEAESALLRLRKALWLSNQSLRPSGVEAVGNPWPAELTSEVSSAAAVYRVGNTCKPSQTLVVSFYSKCT